MTITKKIMVVFVKPEINKIGAVDWELICEHEGEVSSSIISTFFSEDDASIAVDSTDLEIIEKCIEIEGGDAFIADITAFHENQIQDIINRTTYETTRMPLEVLKLKQTNEVRQACELAIVSGFNSDALGSIHTYQSDRDDQLNLIGMVSADVDDYFKCFDSANWEYKLHTVAQLKQVLQDGKSVKLVHLQKFNTLKSDILAATTQAEIESVVW